MPLRQLADDFHVDPDVLREDLLAFYAADVAPDLLLGLLRPGVLEFLGPDGDDEDPAAAEIVRISDPRSIDELGVEHVDASELALIYTAATSLLDVEPDNDDLAAAIDALSETMLGDAAPDGAGTGRVEPAARADRRGPAAPASRVDIVYSRAWEVGVSQRIIEPYRLVRTRRGWEVDAGPLDERGTMRTFLLSNIRAAELRTRPSSCPTTSTRRLAEQRATDAVRVEIPQSARWAADMYAEQVTVIDDRETTVELDLELLPPLEHRLGLLMLAAGRTRGCSSRGTWRTVTSPWRGAWRPTTRPMRADSRLLGHSPRRRACAGQGPIEPSSAPSAGRVRRREGRRVAVPSGSQAQRVGSR